MKRLTALILAILCLLPCIFACSDDDTGDNNETNASDYGTNLVDVDVLSHKLTDYVTLGQYKGITYKPASREVTDKELQAALDEFRNVPVAENGHVIVAGNTVVIDYVGTVGGVSFQGGTANGQELTIGSNSYIEGFETGLVGKRVGETCVLDLKFPEKYHSAELAGKECQFTVTIQKVYKLQELTDDFVAEHSNNKYTSVDALKRQTREDLQTQKNNEATSEDFATIWKVIKDGTKIRGDLPEQPIKNYYNLQLGYFEQEAQRYGYTPESFATVYSQAYLGQSMDYTAYKNYLYNASKSYMEEIFILYAIAAKENLLITRDEYFSFLAEQIEINYESATAPTPLEYDAQLSPANRSYLVTNSLLMPKVIDFIIKNAVKVSQ